MNILDIKKIIAASDKDTQIDKAIEECSELIKALLKERYAREIEIPTRREEIIEEIADVLIMCWQLQVIFEIPDDEIRKTMEGKIKRTLKRLGV